MSALALVIGRTLGATLGVAVGAAALVHLRVKNTMLRTRRIIGFSLTKMQ